MTEDEMAGWHHRLEDMSLGELTGLADDDRAGAYDHDALKVCTLRHVSRS